MNKSNGVCKLCSKDEENIAHLIFLCPNIKKVWAKIEILLTSITELDIKLNTKSVILGVTMNECDNNVDVKVFVNFVVLMTKWCIWKHRNDVKYGKKDIKSNEYIYNCIIRMCQKDVKTISESSNYCKCKQELKLYMLELKEEATTTT